MTNPKKPFASHIKHDVDQAKMIRRKREEAAEKERRIREAHARAQARGEK